MFFSTKVWIVLSFWWRHEICPRNSTYIYSNLSRKFFQPDSSQPISFFLSGGCIPVSWLSQTRRNLTTEFLDLNFASRTKCCVIRILYPMKKLILLRFILRIILCGKVFIFLCFGSYPFCKCILFPSLSDINILRIACGI